MWFVWVTSNVGFVDRSMVWDHFWPLIIRRVGAATYYMVKHGSLDFGTLPFQDLAQLIARRPSLLHDRV